MNIVIHSREKYFPVQNLTNYVWLSIYFLMRRELLYWTTTRDTVSCFLKLVRSCDPRRIVQSVCDICTRGIYIVLLLIHHSPYCRYERVTLTWQRKSLSTSTLRSIP
eukprot:sb/3477729/